MVAIRVPNPGVAVALLFVELSTIAVTPIFAACDNPSRQPREVAVMPKVGEGDYGSRHPAQSAAIDFRRITPTCAPPDPIIPISGKRSVDFGGKMPPGINCRGLLYEVAAGRDVTSPAAGFVRVGEKDGKASVVIKTDIRLEVTVAGNFELEAELDDFVLHAEPLGHARASAPAFVCLEARKCDGTIVDPRPWIDPRIVVR